MATFDVEKLHDFTDAEVEMLSSQEAQEVIDLLEIELQAQTTPKEILKRLFRALHDLFT